MGSLSCSTAAPLPLALAQGRCRVLLSVGPPSYPARGQQAGLPSPPSFSKALSSHGVCRPRAYAICPPHPRGVPVPVPGRGPAPPPAAAASEVAEPALPGLPGYRHFLVPVMDRNPHLNEATRQTLTFVAGLAKASREGKITIVVIDEDQDSADHKQRLESIRFYLDQGGFPEYGLMERLGEGKMPAAVVGQVADDLDLDLVVMSMEAIHHKHIDCNLLAEFSPCPVLLLPL